MRPKSRLSVATAVAGIGSLLGSSGALADDDLEFREVSQPAPRRADVDPPFAVRDQNPLLAGFGLPVAMPSRIGVQWAASLDISWGSTALTQEVGEEAILLDAETREARVTLQGPISDRFAWQLQLPYRYTGGGNLDSFIDSWHDFFGLAEGARPLLPRDQTNIVYARSGARQPDMRSSASGLADIQVALGYSILDSADTSVMSWLAVELPTGDEYELTGNEATDVSLLLSAQYELGERWLAFGQVAGSWLGETDLLPLEQHDVVWSAMAGMSVRVWGGLSLKAQLDAHTAAYDSNLDILNEAMVLTVGGHLRFPFGRLDFGVSEDLAVEHSPDVVFVIGLKQEW